MTTRLAETRATDLRQTDDQEQVETRSVLAVAGTLHSRDGTGAEPAAWTRIRAVLRSEMGDDTFGSWIAPAQLRYTGSAAVVVTPTGYARDWIRRNAWRRITELWSQFDASGQALELKSRQEAAPSSEQGSAPPSLPGPAAPAPRPTLVSVNETPVVRPTGLQDRFQFEGFVQGPSNEFALSVARRIASWADGCFNPVLIHGPYGFGKTHLLNAIGWEASRAEPGRKVVYLTAADFTQTFVRALMEKQVSGFKDKVRNADLLLIDDVQFIGGKKSSEEELFHTLTVLMSENRRMVFCADRPPEALTEVDARLRSHLGSGLVCGIEAADRTLRLGILQRKLELLSRSLGVPLEARPEVMTLLADRFPGSVRELEGGLNTLVAKAGERLSAVTADEAHIILRSHLRAGVERKLTVDEIQKTVAEYYGLKKEDMLSERRTRAVARPRQAAMYLCKTLTVRSYPDIGRRFGGRDHTTVLHAVRRIEALKAEDPVLATDIEVLTRKLRD